MNSLFTPTTTAAVTASTASLGLIGILLLIALMVKLVLFEGIEDARATRLVGSVSVVIVPLLVTFALIMYFRISGLLH